MNAGSYVDRVKYGKNTRHADIRHFASAPKIDLGLTTHLGEFSSHLPLKEQESSNWLFHST